MDQARPVSYSGQGFSLLGEKGRFVLPPEFRKAVRESGQGERILCLTRHSKWKCLIGFGLGRVAQFEAELDREERIALERGQDFDREMRAAQLYGFTQVPFDDSGRFVLPERYFRLGGLTDAVYFQGGGLQAGDIVTGFNGVPIFPGRRPAVHSVEPGRTGEDERRLARRARGLPRSGGARPCREERQMSAPHIPVLLDEVIAALAPAPGAVIVDATFGAGG